MLKGIIFDLDGVLVHTDEMHYQAWKKVADRLNIVFNKEINNRLRGVSRMESLEIILENYKSISEEEKIALAEEKNEIYKQLLQNLSEADVSENVLATLQKLKEKGLKLAIGSSSKNAAFILNQVKIADYFDVVSDGNNISKSKPDPEVFLIAAERLGFVPAECVVVEDAYAGIDAAVAGGFISVGIGDAASYDKADRKINLLSEILNM